MKRIAKIVGTDILRNRIVVVYTLILACLSWSVFALEDNSSKGLLTLLNIILLTVPLVSVIFSTIYIYNSQEFIELLLSQPVQRKTIWRSLFYGLSLSLSISFFIGAGLPILIFSPADIAWMMVLMGCAISIIFAALAMLSSIFTRDKARGIGIAIVLWLMFSLLFDGLLMFLSFQFAEYPIEKPMVAIVALNPIDLARILILLHLDVSAMMGQTGAIFKNFFGTHVGIATTFSILGLWVIVPYKISLKRFEQKDL
ncbi:MAG: ABC transporter permease subunit [Bacteroidia bacterium]|nr:ABC transporter permease subunit [Bacteroidia bacterium]